MAVQAVLDQQIYLLLQELGIQVLIVLDVVDLKLVEQAQWNEMCQEVVLVILSDHFGLKVKISPVVQTQLTRKNPTQLLHYKACLNPGLKKTSVGGSKYQLYFVAVGIPVEPHWHALSPTLRVALCTLIVSDISTTQ